MYLQSAMSKHLKKTSYAGVGAGYSASTRPPPPPGIDLMVDTQPSFSGVAVPPIPVSASQGNLHFQTRDPRGDVVYTHGPVNMPLPVPVEASPTDQLYSKLK